MPVQGKHEFLVEEINAIFRFSDNYRGFCELIIVADETSKTTDTTLKIAELAIKLNKLNHSFVRTKVLHYTSSLRVDDLVEMSMNYALGQKMVIVTSENSPKIDVSRISGLDMFGKDVMVAECLISETIIEEVLGK
jgi:hypothetical protein